MSEFLTIDENLESGNIPATINDFVDNESYEEKWFSANNVENPDVINNYHDYINRNVISNRQNEVFYNLINSLKDYPCDTIFYIEKSIENEIVITRKSHNGIRYISIDDEGDIMSSYAPNHGEGKRNFYDYGEKDFETISYDLLG